MIATETRAARSAPPIVAAATRAMEHAGLGLALIVCGAGLALGLHAATLGIVTAEGAWRGLRASQVLFGGQPSIGALGFDAPPLPTLLQIPLTVVPALRSSTLAGNVVASVAAPLAAWSLFGALRALGAGKLVSLALTAGLLLHPLMLYLVATGSGQVLATALLLLAVRLSLAWTRTREGVPLVVGAFALGSAALARYDLLAVGAALIGVVGVLGGHIRAGQFDDRLSDRGSVEQRLALALAFAAPIASLLGVWMLVTAMATGNPFAFVAAEAWRSPANGAGQVERYALLVAMPLAAVVAATLAAARRRELRPATLLLGAALIGMAASASLSAIVSPATLSLVDALPTIALGLGLVGVATVGLTSRTARGSVVCAGLVAAWALGYGAVSRADEWGQAYPRFLEGLTGRAVASAPMWPSERQVADHLRGASAGRDLLMDDRRDFIPAFLIGQPGSLIATADADYADVLADPRGRATLVLVRTPALPRTSEPHAITRAWPTLFGGGLPWAELVGEWAVTGAADERYRVYEIRGDAR